ncbi:hypothetical protein [Parasitella parasitica]|uniref:Uncharacterized protein n=1 Tax=Parasitella parasitica TaxID=35722 RepID=A0A0B7NG28_9FUNG|nr:hypothetical protein [Parasitella parasitica]
MKSSLLNLLSLSFASFCQSAVRVKDYIISRQNTPLPESPSASQAQPPFFNDKLDDEQGTNIHDTAENAHKNDWWFENDESDGGNDFFPIDEADKDEDSNSYLEASQNNLANANDYSKTWPSSSSVASIIAIGNNNESEESNSTADLHSLAPLDNNPLLRDAGHTGPQSSIAAPISIIKNDQEAPGNVSDKKISISPWNNVCYKEGAFKVHDPPALDCNDRSKDGELCNSLFWGQESPQESSSAAASALVVNDNKHGGKQDFGNGDKDKHTQFIGPWEADNEESSLTVFDSSVPEKINYSKEYELRDSHDGSLFSGQESSHAVSQASVSAASTLITSKDDSRGIQISGKIDKDKRLDLSLKDGSEVLQKAPTQALKSASNVLTVTVKNKKLFTASHTDQDNQNTSNGMPLSSKCEKKMRSNVALQPSTTNTVRLQEATTAYTTDPTIIDKENFFYTKPLAGKRKREYEADDEDEAEVAKPRKFIKTKRQSSKWGSALYHTFRH